MEIKIKIKFKDFEKISLTDSNKKFQVFFDKENKEILIKAKDYSSLRAGANAILKELIIFENLEKRIKNN